VPSRRPRRGLVAILLALAVVTGFVGILAVWIDRQALNTANWTSTSSRLLQQRDIQKAVGDYLVDQLWSSVDVPSAIASVLPKEAAPIAAPLSAGLRGLAYKAAPKVLATPAAQAAWRQANRIAHAELVKVIDGGGSVVGTRGGVVTLNLHGLFNDLARRLGSVAQRAASHDGLSSAVSADVRAAAQGLTKELPRSVGRIVILRSGQLKTAQDLAAGVRGLAVVFTVLPLALAALALLIASGWRRIVLRRIGLCAAGIGLVVLIARQLIGTQVIDALVTAPSAKPAATTAWSIATSLLRGLAVGVTIYGLVVLLVVWITGPSGPARAIRRALPLRTQDRSQPLRTPDRPQPLRTPERSTAVRNRTDRWHA
jgi:hypothetical protein